VENRKITEIEIEGLCRLLENPDRGVVDAVSKLLRKHPEPSAAKCIVQYTESGDPALRNLAGDILLKMGEVSV
jgi:hypothetical protein